MSLPDWVACYKEPHTVIKYINNAYYKYAVSYRYSTEKRRTITKPERLLGKITREDGFVPSDKDRLRQQGELPVKIDIRTYGIYRLFADLLSSEIATLKDFFRVSELERLLVFAMMRFAYQSPIKRVPHYYTNDYCSRHWCNGTLTDKKISQCLRFFGQHRETVVKWMRTILDDAPIAEDAFVMMDSTHILSVSEKLNVNAKGYNPSFDFGKQIRLMYIFSSQLKQPVYYRLIGGNIPDVSSMALCLKELNAKNIIFVADKGFYSDENVRELNKMQLEHIVPLHRDNALIDISVFQTPNFKEDKFRNHFIYQNRVIWYWQYKRGHKTIVSFLDEQLRVSEENDYLQRIKSKPDEYTQNGFMKKRHTFGTLTILYKTKNELSPEKLYETYKLRNEIEVMFDSYKNFLGADTTYMQDRLVMEGWLFANFIAMTAYCKLVAILKNKDMLAKSSPKDIVEIAKNIYVVMAGKRWRITETTAKVKSLFKKIGIDILNLRS